MWKYFVHFSSRKLLDLFPIVDQLKVSSPSITVFMFLYLSASVLWPYCILKEIANADMLLMHSEEYMTRSWPVRHL